MNIIIIVLRSSTMKYKKELRWLLFLLIPFILMLAIHVFVPLEILTNSHVLQNQNYALNTDNLSHNTLQSLSIVNSQAIQRILDKYTVHIRQFNAIKPPKNEFLKADPTISMNSAFQYSQTLVNSSSKNKPLVKQSMWFSPNFTNYSSLSSSLRTIYDSYRQKELFVRSFGQQLSSSPIESISTLYITSNQSIVFEYPTKFSSDYSNLTSTAFMGLFRGLVDQMQQHNLTTAYRTDIKQVPSLNASFLVVCFGSVGEGIIQATCYELNLADLAKQIQNSINFGVGLAVSSKNYLLLNLHISSSSNPRIIYQFDNIDNSFSIPFNTFLDIKSLGLSSSIFIEKSDFAEGKLYVSLHNKALTFKSSIAIGSTNSLSLLTVESFQQTGVQTVDLKQSLNTFLIPIVILIVLGSLISAIVLKVLLDSLDNELYELQHRCQFIVQGDTNIEIPEYMGTEDIRMLYEQVKIINKLHRYTISEYFSGHFAEKVLKYNQCLQFLQHLGYDSGAILQNIGQSILQVQEWEKSIEFLKKSVELGLCQLKTKFNLTLDQALKMKGERKGLPYGYKEFEVILRRRLFKLTFSYIKYVELRQIAAKTVNKADQQSFKNKLQSLLKEWIHYTELLKKAFYPDFGAHSQCIISLAFESKQYVTLKDYNLSLKLLQAAEKYFKIYSEQYSEVTKKLRQKGSKFKLLHMKHKMTGHSRINPDILKSMFSIYSNRIKLAIFTDPDKYNQAFKEFAEGIRGSICTLSMYYLLIMDLRKFLIDLKIDPKSYESTQIFKQGAPFKTLYYGQLTKEVEPQLLKFPTKISPGLEREYIFLIDCARNRDSGEKLAEFFMERASHIFEKRVKRTDRLSIIKFNGKNGIKIECKLTLKQSNEAILQKEIRESFKEPRQARGSFEEMIEAFQTAVNRVKALQSEKIIVMFFKSLAHYVQLFQRLTRRKKRTNESLKSHTVGEDAAVESEDVRIEDFGEYVVDALRAEGLRNCKVIFYCAAEDAIEDFRSFFGLQQINKRIYGKYNFSNNLVYIIDDKHRADIDRILMLKAQEPADNHVFIL